MNCRVMSRFACRVCVHAVHVILTVVTSFKSRLDAIFDDVVLDDCNPYRSQFEVTDTQRHGLSTIARL
jgi:hypothetical protein